MTKPQKIEGGTEERFDKWRDDGEHESLSDKNGIISHWEVKMLLEFIHQELILKGVADFGITLEEIEKAKAEAYKEGFAKGNETKHTSVLEQFAEQQEAMCEIAREQEQERIITIINHMETWHYTNRSPLIFREDLLRAINKKEYD